MAQAQRFKSVIRTLVPGQPYQDAAQVLDALGAQGWQLVNVQVTQAILLNTWVEVFYLQATGTASALPAE